MLSYQHEYHAGCLADVHKHMALSALLKLLTKSKKSLSYIESHAGRGMYNLASKEALKTGEAKAGIQLLQKENRLLEDHPYTHIIQDEQAERGENFYPGSPLIALNLLRKDDHADLMELHPKEFQVLENNLSHLYSTRKGLSTLDIHKEDGLEMALKLLPNSGDLTLLFVDPSYEIKAEYEKIVMFFEECVRKNEDVTLLLWYPMLNKRQHTPMAETLKSNFKETILHQEILFADPAETSRMYGSGLLCCNAPVAFAEELEKIASFFQENVYNPA